MGALTCVGYVGEMIATTVASRPTTIARPTTRTGTMTAMPTATPKKPAATLKAKATALPLPSGNDAATADENDGDDAAEKNPEPPRKKTEVDASRKD